MHVTPRSVLAGAPGLIPAIEAVPGADPAAVEAAAPLVPRRRLAARQRLAALLTAGVVLGMVAVAVAGGRVVLAQYTSSVAVSSNSLATGTWITPTTWYLHNNPTPPSAATTAQFGLGLNAVAPTVATLYNYDTNCEARAGRSLVLGTGLVGEATLCDYATWRSAALPSSRVLNGTATLVVWARKTSTLGTNPTLRAFLRDLNPGNSTYTELGTANVTVTTESTAASAKYSLTWTLASVRVPAADAIELKLVATGGNRNIEIAYDTTTTVSSLALP